MKYLFLLMSVSGCTHKVWHTTEVCRMEVDNTVSVCESEGDWVEIDE
jgi:hypothetical protein